MAFPILLLVGTKGSGKSTVADILVKNFNCVEMALADPLKRFVMDVFDIPREHLWGESVFREKSIKIDPERALARIKLMQYNERIMDPVVRAQYTDLKAFILSLNNESSCRQILQWIGTEFGRKYDPDFWINEGIKVAKTILKGGYKYNNVLGLVPSDNCSPPESIVISDGRFINEVMAVSEMNGFIWKISMLDQGDNSLINHPSEYEINKMSKFYFDFHLENSKKYGVEDLYFLIDKMYTDLLHNSIYYNLINEVSIRRYEKFWDLKTKQSLMNEPKTQ